MKVLLTGASGFVGRHVAAELHKRGIPFVTLGRSPVSVGVQHIECNLLSKPSLETIFENTQATHLIHLAWYAEHGKYWFSPLNIEWAAATSQLLNAFYQIGGEHALVSGTCAEYDWSAGYCVEGVTPEKPSTLYGMAKNATRQFCESIQKEHAKTLSWARLFFPYGPGESTGRLIPSLFKAFHGKVPPFGVNAGAYRDFLHVSDVASAIVHTTVERYNGTLNISSGAPISLREVVQIIAGLCNADPDPVLSQTSTRCGEPKLLVGNNMQLLSLGWAPQVSLQNGLSTYPVKEST